MINNKKIAFVCAVHESVEHRPTGFTMFNNYFKSLRESCKYPFKLFAYDNASKPVPYTIDGESDKIRVIRVEDQYAGGCTYTWNEGIKLAMNESYDAVIIMSDDQLVDHTINNFIDTILTHELNDDAIFGPLSNNPNNKHQLGDKPTGDIFEISGAPGHELNGFCMGMSAITIANNYFDKDGNFFNTGPSYSWGAQDVEVQKRVKHSIVVGTCYVYHMKHGGWREIRRGYRG
jgi:hypothetical protein